MKNLGKLEEITDLRKIWLHEALEFTPWLADEENMAILSDAVGLEIAVDETESSVGDFNVDIFAYEVGTDRKIIIENQLEDTNHDHLGKLITYASGKSADIIIWLVKRAREEHKAAIEWLNNHTDDQIGFFLCEIKLYKIGNSDPAVKFEVVEKPNNWTKEMKKNSISTPLQQLRYEYWTAFDDYAFSNANYAKKFKQTKSNNRNYKDLFFGASGFHIVTRMNQQKGIISAEIYIGDDKELYSKLYNDKTTIEEEMDMKLDWREQPTSKASKIIAKKTVDFDNKENWKEQFDWIMDVTAKMKNAFKKYL